LSKVGCAWAVTGVLGIILVSLGVLGLFDPQGAQAANDNDPFGAPPSVWFFVSQIIVGLLLMVWPVFLQYRIKRQSGVEGA